MQSMFTYSQPRALFSRNIKMQSIVFMEYVFTLWFFFFLRCQISIPAPTAVEKVGSKSRLWANAHCYSEHCLLFFFSCGLSFT